MALDNARDRIRSDPRAGPGHAHAVHAMFELDARWRRPEGKGGCLAGLTCDLDWYDWRPVRTDDGRALVVRREGDAGSAEAPSHCYYCLRLARRCGDGHIAF